MKFIVELDQDLPEAELRRLKEVLPALVDATLAVGHVDQRLVNLFVGARAPTLDDVRAAQREAAAYTEALATPVWLTAAQVEELARLACPSSEPEVRRWKRQRRTFSIRHQGVEYLPRYALGADFHPRREVGTICRLLRRWSGTRLAAWFEQPSGLLDGGRPREFLASEPRRVIDAAQAACEAPRPKVLSVVAGDGDYSD